MRAELEVYLKQARDGDDAAREHILIAHRPFVQRIASAYCKRKLEWGRDDELSEAWLALNRAIDSFDSSKGVPFQSYVRTLITRQLRDYLRKKARSGREALAVQVDQGQEEDPAQVRAALQAYADQEAARERAAEIEDYVALLQWFGIALDDLVDASPKHRDSRELCLKAARILAWDDGLWSQFESKKLLPINELLQRISVSRKVLENHRKYILAMALILRYREQFSYMYSYLSGLFQK